MRKDILEEIVAWKRQEVAQMKTQVPPQMLYRQVEQTIATETAPLPSLRQALMDSPTGIIAEFKRKSPSKGWINEAAQVEQVTLDYQRNGAAAVSILTDQRYFGGEDHFVTRAREAGLRLPVLYKNFVVDEYQLFQARRCGASAALLIAADLQKKECRDLLRLAHELGLEVLLEMHGEEELDYAEMEPDVCGINNRHLGSFVTDVRTSFEMARRLPSEACKVSESGISQRETVEALRLAGYNGFLIGETFMKTADPGAALKAFCASEA